jgi:hypothetical protein
LAPVTSATRPFTSMLIVASSVQTVLSVTCDKIDRLVYAVKE